MLHAFFNHQLSGNVLSNGGEHFARKKWVFLPENFLLDKVYLSLPLGHCYTFEVCSSCSTTQSCCMRAGTTPNHIGKEQDQIDYIRVRRSILKDCKHDSSFVLVEGIFNRNVSWMRVKRILPLQPADRQIIFNYILVQIFFTEKI